MSNWWKQPFLIWEIQSQSLPKITLLGSVQVPFTNTANGGLASGISAFVQLLAQIINNIFVCNFLHFCCIWNPTYARTSMSSGLYSSNVKLVKTTTLGIEITIDIIAANNVTSKCATTIYNTANGALTSGISVFVQLVAQIINNIFVSNFLHFCYIRNPT